MRQGLPFRRMAEALGENVMPALQVRMPGAALLALWVCLWDP